MIFPRARLVFDRLINERIWTNEPAKRQLVTVLGRRGLGQVATSWDDLGRPAPELDALAVNYRAVSFGMDDLDDMTAALGNFVFKVVLAAEVQPVTGGRTEVTVREVGVFIRDSYDFNGSQSLGYWDEEDNDVSMVNPFAGEGVTNATFRAWRSANGLGGDFLVFSDVKRVALPRPDVLVVP